MVDTRIAPVLAPRQMDAPPQDKFFRRGMTSVAVLDGHLYIEGGEVMLDGEQKTRPLNYTLSLPLTESWEPATATFKKIDKGSNPMINSPRLWVDSKSKVLYSWGGEGPWADQTAAKAKSLWAFKPDANGDGTWGVQEPANPEEFSSIIRSCSGAATTCGNIAINQGGFGSKITDLSFNTTDHQPVPGLLTFDMESKMWSNKSDAPLLAGQQTTLWSSATSMPPGVSSNHLAFFLGGERRTDSANFVTLGNITFYDPQKDKWYWQRASGAVPPPRNQFCAVGASSSNGTYEIFVHGGQNVQTNTQDSFSDTYVLTIPGFHWTKASVVSPKRHFHACALAGNRQMIVVGGVGAAGDDWTKSAPDPWPQGLGVLDLSRLVWTDGYDAKAPVYESPEEITKWYADGGLKAVEWDSNEVKDLFHLSDKTGTSPQPTVTSPPLSETSPVEDSGASQTTGKPIGAIVGGTVGGLALLALIGLLFFFYRRRRLRAVPQGRDEKQWSQEGYVPEGFYQGEKLPVTELPGVGRTQELPSEYRRAELP